MSAPAAEGVRVPYADLPAALRRWVDDEIGSPVVAAVTQPGGFSPGAAARLRTASGRRAFVKAVSAEVNVDTPHLHRREAEVLRMLPDDLPVPALISSYDEEPWVALLIEDVDGRQPALPWRLPELELLLATVRQIGERMVPGLRPLADEVDGWRGWRTLAANPPPDGRLDSWARQHLDRLATMEGTVREALPPLALQHSDTRADNTLLCDGLAWVVDWPWAGLAPRWWDVVAMAPSVAMQGGPQPEDLLARSGLVTSADVEAVTVAVAAIAGYLVERSLTPPPPGLPTVRLFQAAQGEVALGWLRDLTGWP